MKKILKLFLCFTILLTSGIVITSCFKNNSTTNNNNKLTNVQQNTIYTLTLNSNDLARGTLSGAGSYEEGKIATITATANSGYHFYKWSDDDKNATRNITITSNITLVAYFAKDEGIISFYNGHPHDLVAKNGQITEEGDYYVIEPNVKDSFSYWGLSNNPSNIYSYNGQLQIYKSNLSEDVTLTAYNTKLGYLFFSKSSSVNFPLEPIAFTSIGSSGITDYAYVRLDSSNHTSNINIEVESYGSTVFGNKISCQVTLTAANDYGVCKIFTVNGSLKIKYFDGLYDHTFVSYHIGTTINNQYDHITFKFYDK